jgi:Spy/CpxP family protein refolding chaperone
MKSTIKRVLLAAALGALGAGAVGIASAQALSSAPGSAPQGLHRGHHHFRGAPFVGALLRATKQLNLTAQQETSVKAILQDARAGHQPGAQSLHPDLAVLGNPGDPGYAGAVQSAEAAATNRIQKESALAGQIYAVLTTAQQQQLPGVLAAIQAKEQARRAQWAARRASGNG